MRIHRYIISCGLVAFELCAANTAWNVTSGDLLWVTNANWTSNAPTIADTASFPNAFVSTITVTGSQSALGLAFTSSTPYILNGSGTIQTSTGGITVVGSAPQINHTKLNNCSFCRNCKCSY